MKGIRRNRLWHFVCVACLATPAVGGEAEAMVLAEHGAAKARIVVGQQARPNEKLAARELAHYLGKISGATFEITTDAGDGPAIFVGQTPQTMPVVQKLRTAKASADTFVIRCRGDRLYLVGSDYQLKAQERPDAGTCHAVYTLLDELGCRWYFPTELGEVIPKRPRLEVAEQDRTVKPSFWYRGSIWYQGWGGEDWMRRNRGGGPDLLYGGHSYMKMVPPAKYEKEHPEYYAVIDGRRWPGVGLCTSNPEMVRVAVETVKADLRRSGRIHVPVSPPDTAWLCECDNCRALDPPQFRRSVTRAQDVAMYGSSQSGDSQGRSDRVVHFANAIARGIRDEFPDARVLTFAYWGYMEAPVKYKPEPNVICYYTLWTTTKVRPAFAYSDPGNEAAQKIFLDNAAVYEDMLCYAYYGNWAVQTYYPVAPHIARDMPWFHKHGMGGYRSQTEPNWVGSGLNYYTLYRFAWDVNTDFNKLFDEYHRDLFGPASVHMKTFNNLLHNAYISHPNARNVGMYLSGMDFLTEPVLESLRIAFTQAKKAAAGHGLAQRRLAFFEKGLDVAELYMGASRDLNLANRTGSLPRAERAQAGFELLRQRFDQPGYGDGFFIEHWNGRISSSLQASERAIKGLSGNH